MFIAAQFTVIKLQNQPKCPSISIYRERMEYYSAIIRNELTAFAVACMRLETIILNELTQ